MAAPLALRPPTPALSFIVRALITALVMQGCGDPPRTSPEIPPLRTVELGADALFLGVFGIPDEGVWIVGGGPDGGVVVHANGGVLQNEDTPTGPTLWWVHGLDRDHLWAVGEAGRILRRTASGWASEESGLNDKAVLWGIWAAAENDLWAVGGSYRRGGPKALVLRSRGDGQWRMVTDVTFPPDFNFYKVWGARPDDVHIVGEGGVTVHWDGTRFSRRDTGVSDLLFTVHGRASGPHITVGGAGNGLAFSLEDNKWSRERLPVHLGLNGVYVRSDGTTLACGERGVLLARAVDGEWFTVTQDALNTVGHRTLHAVWGDQTVWAVGGDMTQGTDGVILTSDQSIMRVESP